MVENVDENIPDNESVIRGICTPYHLDRHGKKLKKGAFRQKNPTEGVSVYRRAILTESECKGRAKKLSSDNKQYVGLAHVFAGDIRNSQCAVDDSREQFYGHADVVVLTKGQFVYSPGEPLPPEIVEVVDRRIGELLKQVSYHSDSDVNAEHWPGPELPAHR
ncbi:hypothetical protein [Pandoraea sp. PE-S2T-3]|uniref:hypothetical protein n=1 Tax=Pandoraea sp. PE-S2T-3 TaxID=1986993 RepID=UPI000B3FB7A6|nr:hypothetical protein [Pandoraea sp. PE-S2T-3]